MPAIRRSSRLSNNWESGRDSIELEVMNCASPEATRGDDGYSGNDAGTDGGKAGRRGGRGGGGNEEEVEDGRAAREDGASASFLVVRMMRARVSSCRNVFSSIFAWNSADSTVPSFFAIAWFLEASTLLAVSNCALRVVGDRENGIACLCLRDPTFRPGSVIGDRMLLDAAISELLEGSKVGIW